LPEPIGQGSGGRAGRMSRFDVFPPGSDGRINSRRVAEFDALYGASGCDHEGGVACSLVATSGARSVPDDINARRAGRQNRRQCGGAEGAGGVGSESRQSFGQLPLKPVALITAFGKELVAGVAVHPGVSEEPGDGEPRLNETLMVAAQGVGV